MSRAKTVTTSRLVRVNVSKRENKAGGWAVASPLVVADFALSPPRRRQLHSVRRSPLAYGSHRSVASSSFHKVSRLCGSLYRAHRLQRFVAPPFPTKAKPSREPLCRGIFPTSDPNPLRHLDSHVVKVASKLKMRKQSGWVGRGFHQWQQYPPQGGYCCWSGKEVSEKPSGFLERGGGHGTV